MKSLFYFLLRKVIFFSIEFKNTYINRIIKDYYTQFVYKKLKNIGNGVHINGSIKIFNYDGLSVGNNVHIGGNCFINAEGGVVIGDNCQLSRNISIYSSSHNYEGRVLPYDQFLRTKQVIIGKNVWIGMNVSIAPGVRIGDGAIIGIGSVINRDVSNGSIIVQTGFKKIFQRNFNHYNRLEMSNQFAGSNGIILNEKFITNFNNSVSESRGIIFVVSTGLSGGKELSSSLNYLSDIYGVDEPHWELKKICSEYLYGTITKQEVIDYFLNLYFKIGVVPKNKIYVESNRFLSPLIEILIDIFPNAQFIWCTDNSENFVLSAMHHKWYNYTSEFDSKGRLLMNRSSSKVIYNLEGDKIGQFSSDIWEKMGRLEKCCWYYKYFNGLIKYQLSFIESDKWIQIDMNNLKSDINKLKDFLNYSSEEVDLISEKMENLFDSKSRNSVMESEYKEIYNKFFDKS